MANNILQRYASAIPLAITVSALPTSTSGRTGRKSVYVSNITRGYDAIQLFISIREGANAVSNRSVLVKMLTADMYNGNSIGHTQTYRTDKVEASNVICTTLNAPLVGVINNIGTTGRVLRKTITFYNPGKYWAVFLTHNMGVNLGLTVSAGVTGNYVRWQGMYSQVQ